jgi:hypothetical protein
VYFAHKHLRNLSHEIAMFLYAAHNCAASPSRYRPAIHTRCPPGVVDSRKYVSQFSINTSGSSISYSENGSGGSAVFTVAWSKHWISSVVAGQLHLCVDGDEGIGWSVGCVPPVVAVSRGSAVAFCCALASSHCPLVVIGCGTFFIVLWASPGFLALPEVRDCFCLFFVERDDDFWIRLLVGVGLDPLRVI